MSRTRAVLPALIRTSLVAAMGVATVLVATPASATALVTKASLSGTDLRIEGHGIWDRTITVDSVPMGTSDAGGNFKIARSGYIAPADCIVDVNDGSFRPTAVRLAGCTPTVATPALLPDTAELGPWTVGLPLGTSTTVSLPGGVGPTSWQITAGALPAGVTMVVPQPTSSPAPLRRSS